MRPALGSLRVRAGTPHPANGLDELVKVGEEHQPSVYGYCHKVTVGVTRMTRSLLVSALLVVTGVRAEEVMVVQNVLGPEGPLVVDKNLYYVGSVSSTLSRWDGRTSTVLNSTTGCGHNGLALTRQKTLLVACNNAKGAIL